MHGAIRGLWSQLGWERASSATRPRTIVPLTESAASTTSRAARSTGPRRPRPARCTARSADSGPSSAGNAASSATRSPTRRPPDGSFAQPLPGRLDLLDGEGPALRGAGAIRRLWSQLGWERSFLGYPTTDESRTLMESAASTTSRAARSTGPPRTHEVPARSADSGPSSAGLAASSATRLRTNPDAGRHRPLQPLPGRLDLLDPHHRGARVHSAIRGLWSQLGWKAATSATRSRTRWAPPTAPHAFPVPARRDRLVRRRWSRRGPRADPPAREGAHHPDGSHHHVAGGDADRGRRDRGDLRVDRDAQPAGAQRLRRRRMQARADDREQNQLFGNRNNVGARDVVVYFVCSPATAERLPRTPTTGRERSSRRARRAGRWATRWATCSASTTSTTTTG